MAKKETEIVKNDKQEVPAKMKVVLKCNHKTVDKDGKVTKHKPDATIEVSGKEGMDLIGKAFAVKA